MVNLAIGSSAEEEDISGFVAESMELGPTLAFAALVALCLMTAIVTHPFWSAGKMRS